MAKDTSPRPRRRRRMTIDQPDRRALERAGWRTLLDYRENHVRGADGRLLAVEGRWMAEAERSDGAWLMTVVPATTVDEAWAQLRRLAHSSARQPYDWAGDVAS